MKKRGNSIFFIVAILILFIFSTSVLGIKTVYGDTKNVYIKSLDEIRWGIDIRGGVDATFTPPVDIDATPEEMLAAEAIIKQRLLGQNITDSEVYTDVNKDRIIVRFPWKVEEENFNPEQAISELGETSELTFRLGGESDSNGAPAGVTKDTVILKGADIESALVQIDQQTNKPVVGLKFSPEGTTKFSNATADFSEENSGTISIWMDDQMISNPNVTDHLTGNEAVINGEFTAEEASDLANKINSGSLPFKLETENFSTISPTLGENAKNAMGIAGLIAYLLIAAFIIYKYKLPGVVASIALLGQMGLSIGAVSGYFGVFDSFTLTLPGIAGIILAIGFGVDANIITAERIKEEINSGKSINGAITSGFKRGLAAIIDGNTTIIIVAVILMGAFGPPNSLFSDMLRPIFFMFGPSTAGAIYSFGYTLLVGVIANLLMGVVASRLMLKSISKFKKFRNPKYYGGENNEQV